MENNPDLLVLLRTVDRITADLAECRPKALLLFGSLARHLAGDPGDHLPNDLDLLVVTNNIPFWIQPADYDCRVELHRFSVERMVGIARSLRYDSHPVALAKLYGRVLARGHAIDIIAAAILLGAGYGDFGIQQIEKDGLTDTRDYSIHRVLLGGAWWQRLSSYATQRRGPWMRFTDKMVHNDDFDG